jgi:hypothetical protein
MLAGVLVPPILPPIDDFLFLARSWELANIRHDHPKQRSSSRSSPFAHESMDPHKLNLYDSKRHQHGIAYES